MPTFDIVHLAHTSYFKDSRVRGQARTAAAVTPRVAVIALSGSETASEERDGDITVIGVPGSKARRSLLGTFGEYVTFTRDARALIRDDPRFRAVRAVHVHTLPDFLVAAALPARRRGAQVILDLHEIFPEFARSKLGGLIGLAAFHVGRWIERWSRTRSDVVVTVNEPIRELFLKRRAKTDERILIVHNFVLPEELGPRGMTTGVFETPLRLVYHGTLTRLYGLDLAIAAVRIARESGLAVTFDLFGDGPVRGELEPTLDRDGLSGAIVFRGQVPQRQLRDLLPNYHAGFVPTRLDAMTQYSFSTKLIEYIHLGLPVVAARLPSYLRYFPEDSLWYFAPNSAADAARAIERLWGASTAERVERATQAQRAAGKVDRNAEVEALQDVYREALSAHPR